MKTTFFLIAFLFSTFHLSAQTAGNNEEEDSSPTEEEIKKALENVKDELNRKRRWEATLPGGKYGIALGAITSISKHTYVLDGSLLVTEVSIDSTGNALARFYYIEPITTGTNFDSIARIQERLKELQKKGQQRVGGTKVDEMAQKSYPTTTHAKTIEFRVMNEIALDALYNSAYRAWDEGKGRKFVLSK